MAKPVLFWGVLEGIYSRQRDVMRVTRETENQLSGVRRGDIMAITTQRRRLLAQFPTEEAALEAIEREAEVRKGWDRKIDEADRAASLVRSQARSACIAALRGEA